MKLLILSIQDVIKKLAYILNRKQKNILCHYVYDDDDGGGV